LKKITILLLTLFLFSCSDKRENLQSLNNVISNIQIALKSSNEDLIYRVLNEIDYVEKLFPEHQSLKEQKYKLQIKLKHYEDAIKTIDSLLEISPDDVDNRVVKGILLEIIGKNRESKIVLEETLELIENKILKMLKVDKKKRLNREINRLMILKLLYRDSPIEYQNLKDDPDFKLYPDNYKVLLILEAGSRDSLINNFR